MKIGKDSVVIGNVDAREIGERCVVIGATDANGNTIINTPMAVGYGAKAGPGSIAIGNFAGAGPVELHFPPAIQADMGALVETAQQHQHAEVLAALQCIAEELRKPLPQPSLIHRAWAGVQALADIEGATSLLTKGTAALFGYLQALG